MNFETVKHYLETHHEPAYRLTQLVEAVKHGATSWAEVKGWSKDLQLALANEMPFLSYTESQVLTSSDGTRKARLTLSDGAMIETVLMQPKPGLYSVCVSSEVGCPMGCAFCATGKMGFKRFLTAEEITDQWLFWRDYHPSHLVFMGMGEPFHNQDNVLAALKVLTDPSLYNLGDRKISVSTCGVIPGIKDFMVAFPQVNLAISLHAATDNQRSRLMPINKAYSLSQLKQACLDYLGCTGRQIMFEYLLLQGVNDRDQDIDDLQIFFKGFPPGQIHLNLIRYNPTNTEFAQPSVDVVYRWQHLLKKCGISVSIRKNLGTDIFGACGQLATSSFSNSPRR